MLINMFNFIWWFWSKLFIYFFANTRIIYPSYVYVFQLLIYVYSVGNYSPFCTRQIFKHLSTVWCVIFVSLGNMATSIRFKYLITLTNKQPMITILYLYHKPVLLIYYICSYVFLVCCGLKYTIDKNIWCIFYNSRQFWFTEGLKTT